MAICFCAFWIFLCFPGFFLYGLRYRFETWYTHLVGGATDQVRVPFIPIRTLSPTLWSKIVQSHFFMDSKVMQSHQILYIFLYSNCRDPHWYSSWLSNFGSLVEKKTLGRRSLAGLSASEKFSGLIYTYFEISIWNLVYTSRRPHHTAS